MAQNRRFLVQRFILQVIGPILILLISSIVSLGHTLVSAIVDFFRSITLMDIINGIIIVFRHIFIEFPQLLWKGVKALARGIHITLAKFFGVIYWTGYYIMYGLGWIALYVPKRIWRIVASVVGGIEKAFKELWVWISPKAMA